MHLGNIKIKLFFATLMILMLNVSYMVEAREVKLCTDSIFNELAIKKHGENSDVAKLLSDLKTNKHIVMSGSDRDLRYKFVNLQALFENTIHAAIKSEKIKRSVAVIYAPYPTTPLRSNGKNIDGLVSKESSSDQSLFDIVMIRRESLRNYLAAFSQIYAIYKSPGDGDIPGFKDYMSNLSNYPNLIDVPITDIDDKYTGASYLVECNKGRKVLFAITGRQADNAKGGEWSLYYGDTKDKTIRNRYEILKHLYKQAEVNFDFKVKG